jgi:hypothetical protein
MFEQLEKINNRPEPFEFYTAADLWTDEHTSGQMLRFHSGLIVSSTIIFILLGGQLPRVRGQEVEYAFLSYLSYAAKCHEDLSGRGDG